VEFDDFFQRQKPRLFHLCISYLGRREEAEDVLQDTFIRVHQRFDRFPTEADAAAWAVRVAINLCTDRLRRRNRWRLFETILGGGEEDEDAPPPWETAADPAPTQDAVMEREELVSRARECIARLKEKYRQVLILREMDGMSYEDIARTLGITLETVGVRLNRAKRQLKSKMRKFL
jgi:RNA polymerase sigma-70 factor, ECF subfamily